jgi:hypothetical protein
MEGGGTVEGQPAVPAPRLLPGVLGPAAGTAGAEARTGEDGVDRDPSSTGIGDRAVGQVSTSGREDPTSPVNSSLQVNVALDRLGFTFDVWKQSLFHCAVSRNVLECLKTSMPGTKGDAVALHLLLQRIPEVWAPKVAFAVSAAVALKWIASQFEGGANLDINEQWLELMDNETMSNESTLEEYVARKELLARRLNANSMPITTAKLKRCILKCLPWQFKPHETSLSASTATCDIPQTLAAIRVVAQNIGFNDQVPRAPRAAVVRKPNPAGGLASIECYHCGELGHVKRHYPKWEGNALPKKGNVPASEKKRLGLVWRQLTCKVLGKDSG